MTPEPEPTAPEAPDMDIYDPVVTPDDNNHYDDYNPDNYADQTPDEDYVPDSFIDEVPEPTPEPEPTPQPEKPINQGDVDNKSSNDTLKTIGTMAGIGAAIGVGAYTTNKIIKDKKEKDEYYDKD